MQGGGGQEDVYRSKTCALIDKCLSNDVGTSIAGSKEELCKERGRGGYRRSDSLEFLMQVVWGDSAPRG